MSQNYQKLQQRTILKYENGSLGRKETHTYINENNMESSYKIKYKTIKRDGEVYNIDNFVRNFIIKYNKKYTKI